MAAVAGLSRAEKLELLALLEEKNRRAAAWKPRPDQAALWRYLESGGTRAIEIAHRRWGKDDVALHHTARAAAKRVGTYWHLLPEAAQARKAIWDAVNPRTGRRRIDEAFPLETRKGTRNTDMFIEFENGSTWQVVGSDNFNSLMGSPPVGIVFSEWALADPRAWALMRPILEENGGWALFITTPRGRNHAARMLEMAKTEPGWFGEVLTAEQTPVFAPEQLERIRREMIGELGEDDGKALFEQEYLCSFDAPLVGAYYASLLAKLERAGHVVDGLRIEPGVPVETAWDLGHSDDTTIWFFQVLRQEIRVLDCYSASGQDVAHYCEVVHRRATERGWTYGDPLKQKHWVPWDAAPKTLASPRSIVQQAWACGIRMSLVPNLGVEDGIQAVRQTLPRCWFDRARTAQGYEALRNYQRQWDDDKKVFKPYPLHNWASHFADAFRYLALGWRQPREAPVAPPPIKGIESVTIDRLWKDAERNRTDDGRI